MLTRSKERLYRILRWSERYTKTDMVYFVGSNFWINVSRVISIGSGMLLTIAFANLLTPEQYGTYKYVLAAGGLIATFSLSGLTQAVMRAVATGKKHVIPAAVRTAALWSLPASAVALSISAYYFYQGNSELGFAFSFIALTNSIGSGIGITKGVFFATGDFKIAALAGIPRIIIPIALLLATIILTKNVVWILAAYYLGNTITSWIYYRWMLWWLRIKGSLQDTEETLRYGRQLTWLGFFQAASGQIDQLLLWHFATPSALATYTLALAPVGEMQNLLNNFLSAYFPKVANKSEAEVHRALPLRMRQMFLIAVVVAALYVLFVPLLFMYVFPKYLASIAVTQALALSLLLTPKGLIDVYFVTHAKMANRAKIILTSQFVRFGLFVALIPLWGLWGAVVATIAAELFATATYLYSYMQTRRQKTVHQTSE